jgi:hypothetical protein
VNEQTKGPLARRSFATELSLRGVAEVIPAGAGALTPQQLKGQIQKALKESTDREKRKRYVK